MRHTLPVLSLLPLATKRPVGSKATERTVSLCPAKVATQVAAAPSGDMRHTLAVLSTLPVATKRPVRYSILSKDDFLYRLECKDRFLTDILKDIENLVAINKLTIPELN